MFELIILAVLLIVLFQSGRIRRRTKSKDSFTDCLVKSCDNFYIRDSASDTEIFKLELDRQQYYSLAEFLQNFTNGDALQKALGEHLEHGKFFLKSKTGEISMIAVLCKVESSKSAILFLDLSVSLQSVSKLEKENTYLRKKLGFTQQILDSSPFLLYGKNAAHEVYNEEYSNWKEFISLPGKSCVFEVERDTKSLLVDARIDSDVVALFGQDNAGLRKNSAIVELYNKRTEIILKNTSEKIIILDHNMHKIACSRAYLKEKGLDKAINRRKIELKHVVTPKTIRMDLGENAVSVEVIPYMKETILIFR
ncbi:hypothetical protein ACJZTR_02140 [Neorickettsia risticii]|uniref:Uncharacterized protein n=1 Tax=Neorickettsia risticii (strain Illinois) TaxID=434131 RepID=C6V506_NEORI|nr:hypothetical protein [Neorickettsia risticii]ACT69471.1 hypothetical protein NRI_0491 [Neorickettsia risticii str. Illinois]